MKKPDRHEVKKYNFFLKAYIKIEKIIIQFGDIEIEKQKFHEYKRPISIKNKDINEIVVSSKVSFSKKSFKYFISYKLDQIRPLCIFLPKMSTYRRDFYEFEYVYFLIKDDEFKKNIMKFGIRLKKSRKSIKKEFNSKSVYNEKYLKAKINPLMEK